MSYGVLIIEDEQILAKKIAKYLTMKEFDVRVVNNGQDGLQEMATFFPEAIILDYNLPGALNGLEVLEKIRTFDSAIKVIMMTGQGNVRLAVDAIKAGAYDYLSKPVVLSELKLVLEKAIIQNRSEGQLSYFHDKEATRSGIDQIIGQSNEVRQLKNKIRRIIDATAGLQSESPPSILVHGETGTGKELVARALHFSGMRADKPFIELNLAAIPSHLLESELFGFEKGAFTDARQRKLGLVEAANGGTLFLDEIGELDLAAQVKLLKLLEDRSVRRLGSIRDYSVDIQVITATNRSLDEMVKSGDFRQDLFYRLNTLSIEVPALRLRNGDALLLANHFIDVFGRKYNKPSITLDASARSLISEYHWPGNIRELRNVMEQALLHSEGGKIHESHLSILRIERQPEVLVKASAGNTPAALPDLAAPNLSIAEDRLADVERDMIEQTMREVNGNISEAARRLGITRDRLRYRLKKYEMDG